LTFDGTNLTLLGGTANGVAYLNGSKVLTTGSSLTFDSAGTLTAPQFYQKQNLASAYNTQILENTASNGFAQFNFYVGASGANGVANIGYAPGIFFAIGPTSNDTTTPITFRANNATEYMRIAVASGGVGAVGIGYTALTNVGNNGLAVLGNVGISTSTASYKLTLQETSGSTFNREYVLRNGDQTNFWRLSQGRNLAATTSGIPTNAAFIVTENGGGYGASSGLVLGTIESAPLITITSGSERTRIDSNGKFGVGLTTINSGFIAQFNGDVGLGSPTRNQTATARIGVRTSNDPADDSRSSVLFGTTAGAASSDSYITFITNQYGVSAGERVRIDPAGNVGIGTSSPVGRIHASSAGNTEIINDAPSGTPILSLLSGASGQPIIAYKGNGLRFVKVTGPNAAGLVDQMLLDSAGIVTMNAYGAGAATFSAAGVISSVSDETWKIKDGVPVDPDSMLKKLEPGYWYYNDEKKETFGVDRQLGFYAQNVNAAIGPEAAPTPEEGKPWGYYDRSVLAVTVMSLQKALATIESLTARITALEST
jgi:hypothetical protein